MNMILQFFLLRDFIIFAKKRESLIEFMKENDTILKRNKEFYGEFIVYFNYEWKSLFNPIC
jgi:hypothetical protein